MYRDPTKIPSTHLDSNAAVDGDNSSDRTPENSQVSGATQRLTLFCPAASKAAVNLPQPSQDNSIATPTLLIRLI